MSSEESLDQSRVVPVQSQSRVDSDGYGRISYSPSPGLVITFDRREHEHLLSEGFDPSELERVELPPIMVTQKNAPGPH